MWSLFRPLWGLTDFGIINKQGGALFLLLLPLTGRFRVTGKYIKDATLQLFNPFNFFNPSTHY
jgi:hypothetical protein